MHIVTPNLHFKGQCKQAIELYKRAFCAEVVSLEYYSDADPQDYRVNHKSQNDLVYHAEILIGSQRIMLSDILEDTFQPGNSISLTIIYETADKVKAAFMILADDATIIWPMRSTTYSSCFVSLIDRYGMRWELMTEQTER